MLVFAVAWAGCGDDDEDDLDGGIPACEVEEPSVVQPIWIAGGPGTRAELGKLGKPDAIFSRPDGILLVGDEHPDHEELLMYDLTSDDPSQDADTLDSLIDLGADPGPAGSGELEFRAISGFAQSPIDGRIFIVEQGNGRVQIVNPLPDSPYLEFVEFFGAFAADRDAPVDGEFVRLQAARTDSMGRLYISDDAKGNAETARRDIQVFSPDLEFIGKFGDSSYGELGKDGNLQEPENFVIDEQRNRIYVADEAPKNIVVFQYDDHSFVTRFGSFAGNPNGVDIDQNGTIFVMDESAGQIVLFDPDDFSEIYRFGVPTSDDDDTPGTFSSPDTLIIDTDRDLIIIADQGHQRIQGFSLSDIQRRACLPTPMSLRLTAPPTMLAGSEATIRVELHQPAGAVARSHAAATATITATDDAGDVAVTPDTIDLVNGVGSASLAVDSLGDVAIRVSVDDLEATRTVRFEAAPTERALTGPLSGDDLRWAPSDGVVRITGDAVVPAGQTLVIEAGALVVLESAARITVDGTLVAEGTPTAPISLVAADPGAPWAQIDIGPSGVAAFSQCLIAGGANTPGLGHCCGPAFYVDGGTLTLTDSVLADLAGKGLYAQDGDVTLSRTQFARVEMGAEFAGGVTRIEDAHFYELRGNADSDGLYFREGGDAQVTRTIVAHGDDDGIDTLIASPVLSEVVVHDIVDKCVSINGGNADISNSLLVRCDIGIGIKDRVAEQDTRPLIERTTIADNTSDGISITVRTASAIIRPELDSIIVWGSPRSLVTEYSLDDITMRYSDLEHAVSIDGPGNISADPEFVSPASYDYRPGPNSPAKTAGALGESIGWPGW